MAEANIHILVPIGIRSVNDIIVPSSVPPTALCDGSRCRLSLRSVAVVASLLVVAVECYRASEFGIVGQSISYESPTTTLGIEVVVCIVSASAVKGSASTSDVVGTSVVALGAEFC